MKKKIGISSVVTVIWMISLSSLSTASFAIYGNYDRNYTREFARIFYPYPPYFVLKDGLYVGIGTGYDVFRIRESTIQISTRGELLNPPLAAKGWMGNLYAGYGRYFDCFYVGGEVFISASDAKTGYAVSSINSIYDLTFKVRNSWGVDLLPGLKLNESTLFYLRFGFVRSYFNSHEILQYDLVNHSVRNTPSSNGYHYGLGFETVIYCNLSLRGEYTYTSYSSYFSTIGNRFSPSNNQAVLGLIYHLNL